MLKGESIVAGVSGTPGTGTLTLAATPVAPGGVDFDVLARATGVGFGNSAAVLVPYTIIEFTSSTFGTRKKLEKGWGTLTLGSSSGIANCTLARTTVQVTATNLDSQPATYNTSAPTAVSIGTAANVLVFIGPSAVDTLTLNPYFDQSTISCNDTYGIPPLGAGQTSAASAQLSNNVFVYVPFIWGFTMLAKRVSVLCSTAYSGGTPVSNSFARLYAFDASGKPGKLLYDFGIFGTTNASFNSTGVVQTGAAGSGYLMTPGDYIMCIATSLSGGTTAPILHTCSVIHHGRRGTGNCLAGGFQAANALQASGTVSSTPNDPASVASAYSGSNQNISFALKDS